jgi:threonine/homoserine/homoserine lactone efflux protein
MAGLDALLSEPTLWALFTAGILLGLTEGVKPGPLNTLVISETLRHDWKAGTKVALSPLITDAPIITISAVFWWSATSIDGFTAILYFAGANFLLYLGIDGIRTVEITMIGEDQGDIKTESLKKGIITNLLNPNPWIFWTFIGSPFLVSAWHQGYLRPFGFLIGFFTLLIGTKIGLAILLDKSKAFSSHSKLLWAIRLSSLALIGLAILFIYQGIEYL